MKDYPSIGKTIIKEPAYIFDKIDGSQIRAEWNKKKGFHKFGTRRHLITTEDGFLTEAPLLIKAKYEESLTKIFIKNKLLHTTCFFEFFGPTSFAGSHNPEPHDVILFDIAKYKKGILLPKEFITLTKEVDTPKLLHNGKVNSTLIEAIREGTLNNMTFEGVVCKLNKYKSPGRPYMFKIQSNAWINKLYDYYGDNETLFNNLV